MATNITIPVLATWILCCSIGTMPTAHARVWHVLADSTGDAPFLAAAVDSAEHGDTIELGSGDFPVEGHYLTIEEKSLNLIGQGMTSTHILGGLEVRYTDSFSITGTSIEPALPNRGLLAVYFVDDVSLVDCTFAHGTFENLISFYLKVRVIGCRFESNRAASATGVYAGGLTILSGRFTDEPVEVIDCVFDSNYSPNGTPGEGGGGGGLYLDVGIEGQAIVSGCVFSNNEAPSGGGLYVGGVSSAGRISNNTFVGNRSEDGAFFYWEGEAEIYGNIFAWNEGFGLYHHAVSAGCNCNLYWRNREDIYGQQWWGACIYPNGGSQVIDPVFCGRRFGDYRLAQTSPALPENYPQGFLDAGCVGRIGALGIGCDESPVIEASWGAIKQQFRPDSVPSTP